jgi:hypothetical protein
MLIGREAYDREQVWHHLRAWSVKGFFCAFMISILPGGFGAVVEADWSRLGADPVAWSNAAISAMFMIDVQIAMVGYLLTMKPLDAQIRTANPFWRAGWRR